MVYEKNTELCRPLPVDTRQKMLLEIRQKSRHFHLGDNRFSNEGELIVPQSKREQCLELEREKGCQLWYNDQIHV